MTAFIATVSPETIRSKVEQEVQQQGRQTCSPNQGTAAFEQWQ